MTITHEDILSRLERGDARFETIEAKQQAILDALKPLATVRDEVAEIKEIVDAWDAVKTASRFVKWMGGMALAIAAIFVGVKTGILQVLAAIR